MTGSRSRRGLWEKSQEEQAPTRRLPGLCESGPAHGNAMLGFQCSISNNTLRADTHQGVHGRNLRGRTRMEGLTREVGYEGRYGILPPIS